MHARVGQVAVALGVAAVIVGLVIMTGALSWFGRLPGDVRYQSGNVRIYAPIVSMLLLSAGASLALFMLRRLL